MQGLNKPADPRTSKRLRKSLLICAFIGSTSWAFVYGVSCIAHFVKYQGASILNEVLK